MVAFIEQDEFYMAAVGISAVSKSFGTMPVLKRVSLDIVDGEFLTLVGPSGCGKTTLLRIIAGLERQDWGDVRIGARVVNSLPPKQRDVAMVFQSYALYPYMTVAENLALPLEMRRLKPLQRLPLLGRLMPGSRPTRHQINQDVEAVADALSIGHLLARRPSQLSGGQRQRVALGRAMVRHPQVFLMDEPLSNLDANLRVETRTEIAELHRRLGTTFIYVTHDQVEAMTMSDRVAVMMDGNIIQIGSPQQIYDDPADLRVAGFIGTPKINVLPAKPRSGGGIDVLGRAWPLDVAESEGAEVRIGVRAESWQLVRGGPGHVRGCAVAARVRHLERLGAETLVHTAAAVAAATVVARVEPAVGAGLALGEAITLFVDHARVLVFDAGGKRIAAHARQPAAILEVAHG